MPRTHPDLTLRLTRALLSLARNTSGSGAEPQSAVKCLDSARMKAPNAKATPWP
jgi:hypothetical protein